MANLHNPNRATVPNATLPGQAANYGQLNARTTLSVKDPALSTPAVGDGTTDDTAALNAAILVAIAANRPLYLPAGTYKTTSQITADLTASSSAFRLYGDGMGLSTILISHQSANHGLRVQGNQSTPSAVTLKDFSIGRTSATDVVNTPKNIYVDYSKNFLCENIESYGSNGWNILFQRCSDGVVRGCYVHDSNTKSGTDGIDFYQDCHRILAIGNRFYGLGDDMLSVGSFDSAIACSDIVFANNYGENCLAYKVYGSVSRVSIVGNVARTCNGGIAMFDDRDTGQSWTMTDILIADNALYDCGSSGALGAITIWGITGTGTMEFKRISVRGNKAYGGQYGFVAQGSSTKSITDLVVENNDFRTQSINGILVDRLKGHCKIVNNEVRDSQNEAIHTINTVSSPILIVRGNEVDGFSLASADGFHGIRLRGTPGYFVCADNTSQGGNALSSQKALNITVPSAITCFITNNRGVGGIGFSGQSQLNLPNGLDGMWSELGTTPTGSFNTASVSGTVSPDLSKHVQRLTLTANTTISTPSANSAIAGQVYRYEFTQGGAGAFTVTWNSVWKNHASKTLVWSETGNVTGAISAIEFTCVNSTTFVQRIPQIPYA